MPSTSRVVYVVGAGLSVGLGFPTIQSLLVQLWDELDGDLAHDLEQVIRFNHPEFVPSDRATFHNIEEVLSEIQTNEQLFDSTRAATGQFTSAQLREVRRALLLKVVGWFHTLQKRALSDKPAWLFTLASKMKEENAQIVSFNWNLVLDKLLFGKQLNEASYGFGNDGGARLLKPHGSLNWFEGPTAAPLRAAKKFVLGGKGANRVSAFRRFRAPVSKKSRDYMPLIIPPVYTKAFDAPVFGHLWREVVSVLSTASEVRFVGFSLAPADFHARFVLRCGFHNQVEGEIAAKGRRRGPTGPARVTVVDPSPQSLARIEQCVGWPCEKLEQTAQAWVESWKTASKRRRNVGSTKKR